MRLRSLHPYTEFSPQWNIPVYFSQWEDVNSIDSLREGLIRNEDQFLNLPVHNDGGTGLGDNSVTSRFSMYNLFDYTDQVPELAELLRFLRISYIDFIDKETAEYRELGIMSWFNIVRPGQNITEHGHGSGFDSYLSGNMHLDNYQTKTYYKTPIGNNIHEVENIKGGLTIFPSYLPHGVNEFFGNDVRVSIAFDLRLPNNLNNDCANVLPFMNEEIYNSLLEK